MPLDAEGGRHAASTRAGRTKQVANLRTNYSHASTAVWWARPKNPFAAARQSPLTAQARLSDGASGGSPKPAASGAALLPSEDDTDTDYGARSCAKCASGQASNADVERHRNDWTDEACAAAGRPGHAASVAESHQIAGL
jgi:hypothetical protein